MSKLWQKGVALNELVERYTVGGITCLDQDLVNADCLASMAHAAMLEKIGILSAAEKAALHGGLAEIVRLNQAGSFRIEAADEDCHTAIENFLVARLGEAGKKIHTGRSRNDQVIAALRLYGRAFLLEFQQSALGLAATLTGFARRHERVPMPGRTHLQLAMPSSVGLWAAAYAEELLDDLVLAGAAYELNDACPLGSAASYGVPLAPGPGDGGRPAGLRPGAEQRAGGQQQPGQDRVGDPGRGGAGHAHPEPPGPGRDPVLAARVRLLQPAGGAVRRFQHHAAEAQSRPAGAGAGQGGRGLGPRRPDQVDPAGHALGLQPRPAGNQGSVHGRLRAGPG